MCLRIDRIITEGTVDVLGLDGLHSRAALSHLLKAMLLVVLKPFGHCDTSVKSAHASKHAQYHSSAQVFKNFSSIHNLRMELPVPDVGVLKWKTRWIWSYEGRGGGRYRRPVMGGRWIWWLRAGGGGEAEGRASAADR